LDSRRSSHAMADSRTNLMSRRQLESSRPSVGSIGRPTYIVARWPRYRSGLMNSKKEHFHRFV